MSWQEGRHAWSREGREGREKGQHAAGHHATLRKPAPSWWLAGRSEVGWPLPLGDPGRGIVVVGPALVVMKLLPGAAASAAGGGRNSLAGGSAAYTSRSKAAE